MLVDMKLSQDLPDLFQHGTNIRIFSRITTSLRSGIGHEESS